jgi:glycosyltransferase involved in cell wall biosynthesis
VTEVFDASLLEHVPLVSVACVTYMHERFVDEALRSVITQQTSFRIEIVVGDDCSSDLTRSHLRRWQATHPDKVRLVLQDKRGGVGANFIATLAGCRGQYIALLDGDDYWSFDQKIQRQARFLDVNPWASACVHDVAVLDVDGSRNSFPVRYSSPGADVAEILKRGPAHTSSIMFRREILNGMPEYLFSLPIGDWPLLVACARGGRIAFLDEACWSTYRYQGQGSWMRRTLLDRTRGELAALKLFEQFLGQDSGELIRIEENRRHLTEVFGLLEQDRVKEARRTYWRFVRRWLRLRSAPTRMVLGAFRQLCTRSLRSLSRPR